MAEPDPSKFPNDFTRVARNRESDVTMERVTQDLTVHPLTFQT